MLNFQMSHMNPTVHLERLLVRVPLQAHDEEMEEDGEGFSEYDGVVESPPARRQGEQSGFLSSPLNPEFALGDPLLICAHFAALDYMRVLRELVDSAHSVQEGRTQAVVLLLGSWGSG